MGKRRFKVIAIDGPAGSGKSTTARLAAKRLGFLYLDTGALYRALTYKVLRQNINPRDKMAVVSACRRANLKVKPESGHFRVYLEGKDITSKLRSAEIERSVSIVAAYPEVRRSLLKLQRDLAKRGNLVIEGRDTTTVVFPRADLKIYLQASLEERAKRRIKGRRLVSQKVRQKSRELAQRDKLDSGREVAPLKKSPDSVVIDTTLLSIPQQVQRVLELYYQKVEVE